MTKAEYTKMKWQIDELAKLDAIGNKIEWQDI